MAFSLPDGHFRPCTTGTSGHLPCITDFMEGFMTADPSIIVSERAVVTMADTAAASGIIIIQG